MGMRMRDNFEAIVQKFVDIRFTQVSSDVNFFCNHRHGGREPMFLQNGVGCVIKIFVTIVKQKDYRSLRRFAQTEHIANVNRLYIIRPPAQ